MGVVTDNLAQNDDDIVVDGGGVGDATDTRPIKNLKQRDDSLLTLGLCDRLCKLLGACNENLDQEKHVQQNDLFLLVQVLEDKIETILGEKDLLDVW